MASRSANAGSLFLVAFLSVPYIFAQTFSLSSYISPLDKTKLRAVFEGARPYQTTASIHYSVLGLRLLGVALPDEQGLCNKVKSSLGSDVEGLYHAAASSQALTSCTLTLTKEQQKILVDTVKPESGVANIFYAYLTLKHLGHSVDDKHVKLTLLEALKTDDSPLSYGYAFHIVSKMTGDLSKFSDSIEDIVAQADEVDDKYLQFEGGLFVTSVVVDGVYKLASTAKKMPTISDVKVLKFINYLLSRKNTHQVRSAYYLLAAIHTIAGNKFYTPVTVTRASNVAVNEKSPVVQVLVTDILGESLGEVTVTAESARHLANEAVVISKQAFVQSKTDKSLFDLSLLDVKPEKGLYNIELSVQRPGKSSRLLGNTGLSVQVKVTTQVSVEMTEIGIGDSDQSTALRNTALQYPKKAASVFEADYHQKVVFKFSLRDKSSGKLMSAHQTFVRLVNKETNQEIVFVAEADSSLLYTFDLDIGTKGKDFGHMSGLYSMDLIVGDISIDNSFSWNVADLQLTFRGDAKKSATDKSTYAKKPEIKHLFREQDKRPPVTVSTGFTVLIFVPLLLLVGLWAKIGVNISNFPFSISAIGFHICLAGIFVLYLFYWIQLNMFLTLRYLGILAVPTFLFGNRLLSSIAAKKK